MRSGQVGRPGRRDGLVRSYGGPPPALTSITSLQEQITYLLKANYVQFYKKSIEFTSALCRISI